MTRRMLEQGVDHLWLDATGLEAFGERFPTIGAALVAVGLDPAHDWLPIAPAAHYLCGGVVTDLDGATSLPGLWAAGEVACSGVHGANRLASNSLLEGMVFGARVVEAIERRTDLGRGHGRDARGRRRRDADRRAEDRWAAGRGLGPGADVALGARALSDQSSAGHHAVSERSDDDAAAIARELQRAMTEGAGVLRDAALAGGDLHRGRADRRGTPPRPSPRPRLRAGQPGRGGAGVARRGHDAHREPGAHTRADHPETDPAFRRRIVLVPVAHAPEPVAAHRDAVGPMSALEPPRHAVVDAVARALAEDLTPARRSHLRTCPARSVGVGAEVVVRSGGVVAGIACADEAFRQVDASVVVAWSVADGDAGRGRDDDRRRSRARWRRILTAERTALNFLGHLSGIATLTRRFVVVAAAAGDTRIWDTRKTTPGLRSLEKAAVRAGGGANHRGNLSDWVLLKDNHLARHGHRRGRGGGSPERWPGRTVHVECDRIDQLREALEAGVDAVLLDNMSPDEVSAAVAVADEHAATTGRRRPLLEISGGITLETVTRYVGLGADMISVGGITNSAPVLDIGLDIEPGS